MDRLTKKTQSPDGTYIYSFSDEKAKEFLINSKTYEEGVDALFKNLCKYEDILEYGYVTEADVMCKKIVYMRPVKHQYDNNYYKYSCPICDMLGNKHQVSKADKNCALCGINLLWEADGAIKNTLMKANRYYDVTNILHNIISAKDDSKCGKLIEEEASMLLQLINGEISIECDNVLDVFPNLYQYVNSYSDTLLHNYAVSVSHRKTPEVDMEDIRAWEILDNLIICLDLEDDSKWEIPSGWEKAVTL